MENIDLELCDVKDEEDGDVDVDLCDADYIKSHFNLKCELKAEEKVGGKSKYILHLSGTLESESNIILGLSDNVAKIYSLGENRLADLHKINEDASVIGVKVSPENRNLFYVGTSNCKIKLWDLRTPKNPVSCFKDTSLKANDAAKPLGCFDVSSNSLFIAAGTGLYQADAYVLFWDVRNRKMLGGYWETHKDDITQVVFHPSDVNKLITGSTDGLINVYDLSQTKEEDALIDTLNTDSSVDQLSWFSAGNVDIISCMTHTSDLQLWKLEDAEPYLHFFRGDISEEIKRSTENTYLASTHMSINGGLFCLAGSSFQGECLRGLSINEDKLVPAFDFKENKQCVRSSWFNKNTNILVTGGEKSILNIWELDTPFIVGSKEKKKKKRNVRNV